MKKFEFPTLSHMKLLILKEFLLKPGFVHKAIQKHSKGCKGRYWYIWKRAGNSNIFFCLVQNLKNMFLWKNFHSLLFVIFFFSPEIKLNNESLRGIDFHGWHIYDRPWVHEKKSRKAELNEFCRYRQGI